MNIELMDIKKQYEEHKNEYDKAVLDVLYSGKYIGGEIVSKFEEQFASYFDTKYAVSCGNGTDALIIALKALNIGYGDEVITTSFTFFATAEAIANVGAKPVFVDVYKDTYCINCEQIEQVITDKTKAIIPVHFYGNACDMDKINLIAKKHNLYVITDCAQSTGTEYNGSRKNIIGDIGCFSFFPTKILGCCGDGGMIVTDNEDIYNACSSYKVHGSGLSGYYTLKNRNLLNDNIELHDDKYHNYIIGCNSRLDTIQAAILLVKMKYIDEFINRRINNAKIYNEAFKGTEYVIPHVEDNIKHSYYIYALYNKDANIIKEKLKENGICTGTYYSVPLHLQPAFEYLGYKVGSLPVAEDLCSHTFAIPVYPELSFNDINKIIDILLK